MNRNNGKYISFVLMGILAGVGVTPAFATTGSLVHQTTFSNDCGLSVGITFDGKNLWYSCYDDGKINRANPLTGAVDYTYTFQFGAGSMAFDKARNVIWIDGGDGNIYKLQLDGSMQVVSQSLAFAHPEQGSGLVDGLAYDKNTDLLLVSRDSSGPIDRYAAATGTHIDGFPIAAGIVGYCYNSGLAIGGTALYEGSNGCTHVWVVDYSTVGPVNPGTPITDFPTSVPGDSSFRDESLTCDPVTFAPTEVMWSKEAYSPARAVAFEIPAGSCGEGGEPPVPPTSVPEFPIPFGMIIIFAAVAAVYMGIRQKMIPGFKSF